MERTLTDHESAILNRILIEQLDLKPAQITEAAQIMADLMADSLDVVEISMKLEETFNVEIPDEAWDHVQTVGDLQTALTALLRDPGGRES
jgi:acyl carrier protein